MFVGFVWICVIVQWIVVVRDIIEFDVYVYKCVFYTSMEIRDSYSVWIVPGVLRLCDDHIVLIKLCMRIMA